MIVWSFCSPQGTGGFQIVRQMCKLNWSRNGTLAISHSGVCTSSPSANYAQCDDVYCKKGHGFHMVSLSLLQESDVMETFQSTEVIHLKKCWGDPPHDVTWCDFGHSWFWSPKEPWEQIRIWQTKSCSDEINSKQMEIFHDISDANGSLIGTGQ